MSSRPPPSKNAVTIEGEVVYEPKGTGKVTNFVLAVPTGYKDYTSRLQCVAWHGDVPDLPYITVGQVLRVEGRIAARSWEHKEKGKIYVTEIIATSVTEVRRQGAAATSQRARAPAPTQRTPAEGHDDDSELPF